jgi:hypothetical protein
VLRNPSIRINAGDAEARFDVVAISDPGQVSSVVEKFQAKYKDNGVKLYSKLDVAVLAQAS